MRVCTVKGIAIFSLGILLSITSYGQNLESDRYFTVDEKITTPLYDDLELDPLSSDIFVQSFRDLQLQVIRLLQWTSKRLASLPHADQYSRVKHFGRWVRDRQDSSCYDTRGKVLARDSQIPVQTVPKNHCRIEKGLWRDAYTNELLEWADQVHVDHYVPLKNAYTSGAYNWPQKKRCLYANFLGNKYHLVTVDGLENRRKGDRHPGDYLPPVEEFRCDYIKKWLKVKAIWGLTLSEVEAAGIQSLVKSLSCDVSEFVIPARELDQQRVEIEKSKYLCR